MQALNHKKEYLLHSSFLGSLVFIYLLTLPVIMKLNITNLNTLNNKSFFWKWKNWVNIFIEIKDCQILILSCCQTPYCLLKTKSVALL